MSEAAPQTSTSEGLEGIGKGYQPPQTPPPFDPEAHKATTARMITFWLLGALYLSIFFQYSALALLVLFNKGDAVPTFEHLFNAWLPVVSGLTGSAVTYYLTKEKR